MGSELVGRNAPRTNDRGDKIAPFYNTYTNKFYELLPFYLSIGMTYDQFWNEDVCLAKYYRQSFELKRKRKNEELWLQGLYIYEALCDVSPILHAFAKKGTKPLKYPKEPYAISSEEIESKKVNEEKINFYAFKERLMNLSKRRK